MADINLPKSELPFSSSGGAPSFEIGQLQLSKHYDVSVIGELGVIAQVAGNCQVEVRSPCRTHASGTNWARVIVRKSRSNAFQIAADVNVGASSDLQRLPDEGTKGPCLCAAGAECSRVAPGPT